MLPSPETPKDGPYISPGDVSRFNANQSFWSQLVDSSSNGHNKETSHLGLSVIPSGAGEKPSQSSPRGHRNIDTRSHLRCDSLNSSPTNSSGSCQSFSWGASVTAALSRDGRGSADSETSMSSTTTAFSSFTQSPEASQMGSWTQTSKQNMEINCVQFVHKLGALAAYNFIIGRVKRIVQL